MNNKENQNSQLLLDLIHDLSNKLTICQGKSRKLLKQYPEDKDAIAMSAAADRSIEILSSIRNMNDSGIKSLDVEFVIESSNAYFAKLESMYNIKITMDLQTQKHNVAIMADTKKLLSITENIIENASKAGATEIKITDRVDGDYVISTFSDNGKGCDSVEKIGTGFTTGGTGRGSRIIKDAVKSMGGAVVWKNNKNGGMRVVTKLRKAA